MGIRQSNGDGRGKYAEVDGIPVDGITGLQTRLSMQARRSEDGGGHGHSRTNSWSLRSPITGGPRRSQDLMHSYDAEAHSLEELAEDSDEGDDGLKHESFEERERRLRNLGGRQNGSAEYSDSRRIGLNATAAKSFDRLRR